MMSSLRKRAGEKLQAKDEYKDTKVLKKDTNDTKSSSSTPLAVKEKKKTGNKNDKVNKLSDDVSKDGSSVKSETKSPYFNKKPKDCEDQDEASVDDKDTENENDTSKRLGQSFYEKSCEDLAKALLGQVLVRMHQGQRLSGRIIETEAYLGRRDKAAHSYKGKTDRNTAMFMDPGTSYVYNIYGMYCCMNISSQGEGEAVLLRSLEPLEGKPVMSSFRMSNRKKDGSSKPMKERDLCNGPSKLTQALHIDKTSINQLHLVSNDDIWIEEGPSVPESKIVISKRINIAYAEEWTDKPLRYYELDNICVSVRDKGVEKQMKQSK